MGSEHGYDVSTVLGAPAPAHVPILGEERGSKVGVHLPYNRS